MRLGTILPDHLDSECLGNDTVTSVPSTPMEMEGTHKLLWPSPASDLPLRLSPHLSLCLSPSVFSISLSLCVCLSILSRHLSL